jgi:hypothetical protein
MKTNKERELSLLNKLWPQFKKALMTKLKDGINNAYFTILRFCHSNEVFIYFDFDHIKPKEIYTIIAEISTVQNLRGVFNKLTLMLAESSNLGVDKDYTASVETRGDSISRSVYRCKAKIQRTTH